MSDRRLFIICAADAASLAASSAFAHLRPRPLFYFRFDVDLTTAGLLAAVFGLSNIFARALGGVASDAAARPFGMRGRLWALWAVQSLGGACALLMWRAQGSLGWTMAVVAAWSICVPMACGATYGVAPFVTRRGLGAAYGLIGSGGNVGGAVTQALFFTSAGMSAADGFRWMGVMTLGVTALLVFLRFPAWGGMLRKGNPACSEADYYLSDYTRAEREAGLHVPSSRFAAESRSQRGWRGEAEAAAAAEAAEAAAAKEESAA